MRAHTYMDNIIIKSHLVADMMDHINAKLLHYEKPELLIAEFIWVVVMGDLEGHLAFLDDGDEKDALWKLANYITSLLDANTTVNGILLHGIITVGKGVRVDYIDPETMLIVIIGNGYG